MSEPLQEEFRFDSPLRGRTKSEKALMDFPFFALDKRGQRQKPITFEEPDRNISIEVSAGQHGMATIYDKDLILYVAGIMKEKLDRGEEPGRTFTFTVNDFMRVTNRPNNADSYRRVHKMLKRLRTTEIITNIEYNGKGVDGAFSWLDSYKVQYKYDRPNDPSHRRLQYYQVQISEFLYNAICSGHVLTYADGYFDLAPLSRRIYDIARSMCGRQNGEVQIGLEKLQARTGYDGPLRRFKHELRKIIERNDLPEYNVKLRNDGEDRLFQQLKADGAVPPRHRKAELAKVLVVFWRKYPAARTHNEIRAELAHADLPRLPR